MSGYARQAALLGASHYLQTLHDDAPPPPLETELNKVCRKPYRRVDRFIQLALLGAARCVQNRSVDTDCGVYLGSSMGPLSSNMTVQDQMMRGRFLPKPFNFVNTLGNIAGFYINDSLQLSAPSVFVSRGGQCLQAVLATALSDLAVGAVTQALVGVVEEAARPLTEHRRRLELAPDSAVAEGSHWLLLAPIARQQDRPTLTLRRYASIGELSACLSSDAIDSQVCVNHDSDRNAARNALRGYGNVISRDCLALPHHPSVGAAWFVGAIHDDGAPWPTLIDADAGQHTDGGSGGAGYLLHLRP